MVRQVGMNEISVVDAGDRLGALIDEVENGREVVITRQGRPVARLVPVFGLERSRPAVEGIRALRDSIAQRGERLSWSDLSDYRDEGRR